MNKYVTLKEVEKKEKEYVEYLEDAKSEKLR